MHPCAADCQNNDAYSNLKRKKVIDVLFDYFVMWRLEIVGKSFFWGRGDYPDNKAILQLYFLENPIFKCMFTVSHFFKGGYLG